MEFCRIINIFGSHGRMKMSKESRNWGQEEHFEKDQLCAEWKVASGERGGKQGESGVTEAEQRSASQTERSTDTAQQAGKMFGSISYSFCLNSVFPYYLFSSWTHNVCMVSLVGLTSFVSECHIVSSTGLEKEICQTPWSSCPPRSAWEELVWLGCLFPFILFSGTCWSIWQNSYSLIPCFPSLFCCYSWTSHSALTLLRLDFFPRD